MSKQLPRKTNPSARGTSKPETSSGRTPGTNAPTGKASSTRTPTAQSRTGSGGSQSGMRTRPGAARNQRQQQGFKLRNSDLAFLFVGLVLVAGLVWIVLSSSNSGSNNSATTGNAGNAGGVPPASTNVSASNGGQTTAGQGNGSTSSNAGKQPEDTTPIAAGQPAPEFNLPDLDGKNYTLSQFKDKTVVLEFFATWCPHCQKDAPMMNQLSEAYKDKNVQVIGVNASPFGHKYEEEHDTSPVTADDIKWFRDSFTVTFPLLLDPNVETAIIYGVKGYPTVYIVGKDGTIASQPHYPFTYEDLTAALDKALQ